MKWGRIVHDAWIALLRHRLRSLLSILGIVFAVVAVVAMMAIAEGAKREILDQIEGLGTNSVIIRTLSLTESQKAAARRRLSRGLDLSDVKSISQAVPAIYAIAPVKDIKASFSASPTQDPFEILAVTAAYQSVKGLAVRQGRFICSADLIRKNLVCVLGAEVSRRIGNDGRIGGVLRLEDRTYRVVGILQERQSVRSGSTALTVRNYNRAVFIPLGTEVMASDGQSGFGELSEIWIRVAENRNVHACAAAVSRVLTRTHGGVEDFQIIVPQELLKQARKTQGVFNIVLGCIAGISLLVGGIGIMNTMLASVAERTREIGIRRAVGATRKHIVVQFLCESIVLTTAGGILGIILGSGGALVISKVAGWKTLLTLWSISLSILMAGCVGLVSGLYPAVRAARLDPARALRHE